MTTLTIDPTATQALLIAWLGVAFGVAGTALTMAIRLWPQVKDLWDMAHAHDAIISKNTSAIVQLDHAANDPQPVTELARNGEGHD